MESKCLDNKPKGIINSSITNHQKISEWIMFCLKMQENDWFRKLLAKLLRLLIKMSGPENKETENLLSQLTETQEDAYTGKFWSLLD